MTDTVYFPPLEKGARVITDVLPVRHDWPIRQCAETLAQQYGDPADLVLVAVPAGEGCAVEAAIRRALRVEATS